MACFFLCVAQEGVRFRACVFCGYESVLQWFCCSSHRACVPSGRRNLDRLLRASLGVERIGLPRPPPLVPGRRAGSLSSSRYNKNNINSRFFLQSHVTRTRTHAYAPDDRPALHTHIDSALFLSRLFPGSAATSPRAQRWLMKKRQKTSLLVAADCDCGERFEAEAAIKRAQVRRLLL